MCDVYCTSCIVAGFLQVYIVYSGGFSTNIHRVSCNVLSNSDQCIYLIDNVHCTLYTLCIVGIVVCRLEILE